MYASWLRDCENLVNCLRRKKGDLLQTRFFSNTQNKRPHLDRDRDPFLRTNRQATQA